MIFTCIIHHDTVQKWISYFNIIIAMKLFIGNIKWDNLHFYSLTNPKIISFFVLNCKYFLHN